MAKKQPTEPRPGRGFLRGCLHATDPFFGRTGNRNVRMLFALFESETPQRPYFTLRNCNTAHRAMSRKAAKPAWAP